MVDAKNKSSNCQNEIQDKTKEIKKMKNITNHYNKEIKRLEKVIYMKKAENKNLIMSQ